jgi:hypothetical protein
LKKCQIYVESLSLVELSCRIIFSSVFPYSIWKEKEDMYSPGVDPHNRCHFL